MTISRRNFVTGFAGTAGLVAVPFVRAQGSAITVSLPSLPIAGLAAVKHAEQVGYFKAEGITLAWENMKSPADSIPTLLSGRHQMSFINVGGIAAAAAQNLPIKIVTSLYFSDGSDQALQVMTDSPIRSVADLKDKGIGLAALRNNYHAAILEHLERAGLDANSVKFTFTPIPQALAALRNKTVDAAQLVEPFAAQGAGTVRPVIDKIYQVFGNGPSVVAYSITSRDFLAKNADVVQRFRRAMDKGTEELSEDQQKTRKAIGSIIEIPEAVLANMALPLFSTDLAVESSKRQTQLMAKFKFIPNLPDIEGLFK